MRNLICRNNVLIFFKVSLRKLFSAIVKSIGAIFLLFIFCSQIFSTYIIEADFLINQSFIAENLCVNKDKPVMKCKGKCYLSKKLKEQQNNDQQVPVSKSQKIDIQPFLLVGTLSIDGEAIAKKITFFNRNDYSVGFAPPNINDLYSGVKVPTLQSSNYKNYEVGGWVAFAQNRVYAEISFYRLNGKNEIVNVRRDDGSYQNENAGITSHKGIELNVKYQPVQELSFRVGGTVAKHRFVEYNLQGKNYSGNEMPQSPSYIMNGEVTYKPLALKGFRISMEGQSVGNYFTDPQNTSKYNGFTVWNARMGYEIKKVEAWVNVINFLNNNYAVTVEKSGYGTSYRPGQLRTINVGMAYHFR